MTECVTSRTPGARCWPTGLQAAGGMVCDRWCANPVVHMAAACVGFGGIRIRLTSSRRRARRGNVRGKRVRDRPSNGNPDQPTPSCRRDRASGHRTRCNVSCCRRPESSGLSSRSAAVARSLQLDADVVVAAERPWPLCRSAQLGCDGGRVAGHDDPTCEVSRPGESHPRALAELYVNVSAHTAPIIQPPASPPADANGRTSKRLRVARRLLPRARLTVWTRWMTRPLCSIEFPRLHRSYGSLRPCASHRASHPWGSTPWISPFTSRRQVPTFHTRAWCRVTPSLCRVPPSQAAGSRWTCPGLPTRPGFDTVLTLSTRCRWFMQLRLPAPYLTRSRRAVSVTLTTSALDRGSARRFGASPCRAAPRGLPSSLVQHGCS